MQMDLSRGGNDRLDGLESQEVEPCSEVSVWLSVLNFYLAMWNADMKLEKTMSVVFKVRKSAKIRNRYNQVPHLTQDTNGKVTNSQLDITNESQDVSHFPVGDRKATINRRAQKHNKHTTEITE